MFTKPAILASVVMMAGKAIEIHAHGEGEGEGENEYQRNAYMN